MPADIQQCFADSQDGPAKAWNVGEVEQALKDERLKRVVMKRCGRRFLNWYNALRKNWR